MSAIALLCILLALAAAVLVWLYVAQRRELQDVSRLSQQLQRIAIGGSLAGRVESGSSKPELSALITAINHLLTRTAGDRDGGRVTPKLFAELGERIHEAVLVHREVILYSNRQFAALVGADRVDLAGRHLGDLVAPVLDESLSFIPPVQRRALETALLLREPEGQPPDTRVLGWQSTQPSAERPATNPAMPPQAGQRRAAKSPTGSTSVWKSRVRQDNSPSV